jgi:hypothetical protein
MDNFKGISVLDNYLAKGRARDDFEIALYGDALRIEPDLCDQLRQAGPCRHSAVVAVDHHTCATIQGHINAFASRMNLPPI